ncbi:fatty acid--CoA ligase family protein [Bacillus fonticola]|uniref:fatty acid--CoA ligase family protein n=1 Tax=Bacillus fonticola TaxID=2728853 RepID=UPI00147503D9|nr:fatty acid--CoA ligase family protein [Bacillus fonticola]
MTIVSRLEEIASANPTKPAMKFLDRTFTYAQTNGASSLVGEALKKRGHEKGDHIAFLLGNTPHFVIGLYGVLRMGGVTIPVNPTYTPSECAYILQDADVSGIVCLDVLLPLVEKVAPSLPHLKTIVVCPTSDEEIEIPDTLKEKALSVNALLAEGGTGCAIEPVEEDDVAIILYTSGTTGRPKGAMLTHRNVYSNARDVSDYLKMDENDRVIATLPMFHVFCLTVALNAPLMNGAMLLIVPKFSPKAVFEVAREEKATIFAGVPTMYNFLYQHDDHTEDFESLRLCVSGGASMPVALLKNFEKKFNVAISEGYGLSEASPVTCFNPLDRPRKPGSIGTSIMNVENKVVNELGEEVPRGEVGELIVRGPNVMKGYYKQPEETAATLKGGWLYTGDLATQDEDGYFTIVDRKKDLVIVGGYNVYPREVEEVLYDHPHIVEVAVIGVPHPEQGELVRAYIVKKDPELTEAEIIAYCQESLAKYKVPTEIEFLEELPKNTTGKILRRSLKEQVQI